MAASDINMAHVQAKFFTKQPQYAVPDTPFSVPASVGIIELSSLINSLLSPGDGAENHRVEFDFLVNGEFLRLPLDQHMLEKNISTETVVEIEYVERHPAPEPEDSLQHDDWVAAVEACNDYILTGCYDNTVRVWNTEGDNLITIPAHSGPVKCVTWINNDDDSSVKSFITGSHDESILIWQWDQQKNSVDCVQSCRGHGRSVDCVAVDQTKTRFCSGSWDKMLKIWNAVPSKEDDRDDIGEKPHKRKKSENKVPTRVPLMTLSGHTEGVSSAIWLDQREICTASWDHSLRLWDLEQGAQKSAVSGNKAIFDTSYSPRNQMVLAASADRHIRMYDPRVMDGAVVKCSFTSHVAWVSSVCWSPTDDHHFLSGSYDNYAKLWDTRSPQAPLFDLSGHDDKILCADWSMPQYLLTGSADNTLKIFRYMDKRAQGAHMDSSSS